MTVAIAVAAVVASYLLGSVPTGLWLGLALRGVDIREQGSKNIGATNTARVLGKKLGIIAFACDVAKGAAPVLAARQFAGGTFLPLACGLAAVAGHMASIYLRFKGGKGVATAAGVFVALTPAATLGALLVFAALFGATRMVSVGSLGAAAALCAAVWALHYPLPICVAGTFVALVVVWKHRANIQRIRAGSENRF